MRNALELGGFGHLCSSCCDVRCFLVVQKSAGDCGQGDMKGYDCAGKGSAEMNEEGSGGSRRRRKDIQPARMFHANASLRT